MAARFMARERLLLPGTTDPLRHNAVIDEGMTGRRRAPSLEVSGNSDTMLMGAMRMQAH
jgi:hypothetical protein